MMMRFDNQRAIDHAIISMVRHGDFEHQESRKILFRKFGHTAWEYHLNEYGLKIKKMHIFVLKALIENCW